MKCPSTEELSCWLDKESQEDYSSHVEECDSCQQAVEDFRKLDESVRDIIFSAQAHDELADSIAQSCQESDIKKFDFTRQIIKIAAILVTAVVVSLLYRQNSDSSDTSVAERATDNSSTVSDARFVSTSSNSAIPSMSTSNVAAPHAARRFRRPSFEKYVQPAPLTNAMGAMIDKY